MIRTSIQGMVLKRIDRRFNRRMLQLTNKIKLLFNLFENMVILPPLGNPQIITQTPGLKYNLANGIRKQIDIRGIVKIGLNNKRITPSVMFWVKNPAAFSGGRAFYFQ